MAQKQPDFPRGERRCSLMKGQRINLVGARGITRTVHVTEKNNFYVLYAGNFVKVSPKQDPQGNRFWHQA